MTTEHRAWRTTEKLFLTKRILIIWRIKNVHFFLHKNIVSHLNITSTQERCSGLRNSALRLEGVGALTTFPHSRLTSTSAGEKIKVLNVLNMPQWNYLRYTGSIHKLPLECPFLKRLICLCVHIINRNTLLLKKYILINISYLNVFSIIII